jgi:uncharacterized membrane protein
VVPPLHPMAVHFPLALLVTAAFVLSLARLRPMRRFASPLALVGTWNLCLGALGIIVAAATGLAAVLHLDVGSGARMAIAVHVRWAMFTTVGVLLLAVWRGAGSDPDSRPSAFFLALLWAITASLLITGYHGGQNVYEYGVGVSAQ